MTQEHGIAVGFSFGSGLTAGKYTIDTLSATTNQKGSYDALGRLTQIEQTQLGWLDAKHLARIQAIKDGKSVTSEFTYWPDDRRIKEKVTDSQGTKTKIHLNQYAIYEVETDRFTSDFYMGSRRVARKLGTDGKIEYVLSDRLGSYRGGIEADGKVKGYKDYTPYGETLTWGDAKPEGETYGFTGMHVDDASGLQQHQARFYDPALGVFVSFDPLLSVAADKCLARPLECNLYGYGRNNPIINTDPTGHLVINFGAKGSASAGISTSTEHGVAIGISWEKGITVGYYNTNVVGVTSNAGYTGSGTIGVTFNTKESHDIQGESVTGSIGADIPLGPFVPTPSGGLGVSVSGQGKSTMVGFNLDLGIGSSALPLDASVGKSYTFETTLFRFSNPFANSDDDASGAQGDSNSSSSDNGAANESNQSDESSSSPTDESNNDSESE